MAIMSTLLEPLHCDALFLEEFCLLDGPSASVAIVVGNGQHQVTKEAVFVQKDS